MKTLSRVKDGNPAAVTVLLLQGVSVTASARHALDTSRQAVNCWFTIEDFVQQEATREEVYELLSL